MPKNNIQDKLIFAKTLFFESGSTQEVFDTLMVGWVIRNRVEKGGWFGNTYTKVCLKKWQFSCWNGKTLKQIEDINIKPVLQWKVCLMCAEYIMQAPSNHNPIPKIYYYYNPMLVSPKWARKMKMISPLLFLDHIFLKEK